MKKKLKPYMKLQNIAKLLMIVLVLKCSIVQGQNLKDTLDYCDSLKVDYIECVNFALGVEKKTKQQDTLINAQKSLISKKNDLLEHQNKQIKRAKRSKREGTILYGVVFFLLGAFIF